VAQTKPTLFERVGGERGIAALVDSFYARVLADPELAPFFAATSMDRLRTMQRAFFSAALDGPFVFAGRPLATVHYGRGIRPPHLRLFVDHLIETLRAFEIDEEDVLAIDARIATYADEITGDTSVDA
jgi:hemoglobin